MAQTSITTKPIKDYHKELTKDGSPNAKLSVVANNGTADKQIPLSTLATYIASTIGTDKLEDLLGMYTNRPNITLKAVETDKAVNSAGVKVAKSGWAVAEFVANLGDVYLFKPVVNDSDVCIFAEKIDKVETRGIDYTYTYDEKGNPLTASATYNGVKHTYTYTNEEKDDNNGNKTLVTTITDDQTGEVIDYLPSIFQTVVGAYQPMVRLNDNAELPTDGYCRFVSNFRSASSIRIAVSYNVSSADLTMKVRRCGALASICTQLASLAQKVDEAKAEIESIRSKVENDQADYYVAENDDTTGNPKFFNGKGNKDFLGEWHPFLIDTTDNSGEVTHPVGQLMDNNFFRFVDGSFAPTVGITEEQRAACDVQLYIDHEHQTKLTLKNGVVVTAKTGAHPYDAVEVYNDQGLLDLYDESGNKVRQLLPWETTEKKYHIGIGRYDTLYPIDRQRGKDGKMLSGIFLKPMVYDGINSGRFPLKGTALAPCPSTTVDGKARNFFFAYAVGDTNTTNGKGNNDLCSMYVNDGMTYPRVSDMSQTTNMTYARKNNADVDSPVPFAEGGYHAINTFLICMELLYGTKYLHNNNLFGSGISSNDSCNSEATWKANGGVRSKEKGTAEWKYDTFSGNTYFGKNAAMDKQNWSEYLNYYRPKEACMESQMAASWATEFGIKEDTDFTAYGNKYRYKNIQGVKGLADGVMNCKVYRTKVGTGDGYKTANSKVTYDIEVCLRMSLIHGMNASGDIFAYWGGGCEMVGTNRVDGESLSDKAAQASVDVYLEADQHNWLKVGDVTKDNLGIFPFESVYSKIASFGPPYPDSGYCKLREGFSPFKTANGGGLGSYQCCYVWSSIYWSSKALQRVRIALRLRGYADCGSCGFRILFAAYSAATTNVRAGGSAQCRIAPHGAA